MNEVKQTQGPSPRHIEFAKVFATEMFDQFDDFEQNEIIKTIKQLAVNRREHKIEDAQNIIANIEKSLQEL